MNNFIDSRWEKYYMELRGLDIKDMYLHPTINRVICMDQNRNIFEEAKEYWDKITELMQWFEESEYLLPIAKDKYFNKLISKNSQMYIAEAAIIYRNFKDIFDEDGRILEVGSAFGGLCKIMKQAGLNGLYTMIDHEIMIFLAKNFLKDYSNIKFRAIEQYEILVEDNYDLLISNFYLSETTPEYRKWIIENIFPICRNCFIIDDKSEELDIAINKNFNKIHIFPSPIFPNEKNTIYMGKK